MIKFLVSACVFVALAYSPFTLADQTTSIARSNEQIQKNMAYEGNATLQGLVRAKYGVNISGLLDFFSHENDTDTDVSGPHYDSTAPEWQPKLLMHLVNEDIEKSKKILKLIPETFVDDGKRYLEFIINIESIIYDDLVYCRDVNAPSDNDWGPWVWPTSTPFIVYQEPTLVKLDCWVWLDRDGTVTWYLKRGKNTEQIVTWKQEYKWGYVKLELTKMFNSSDTGSVIVCDATPDFAVKKNYAPPRNITLIYYKPIDDNQESVQTQTEDVSDECTELAMLGLRMPAVLALSVILALATYIVLMAIECVKKKPQTEDRNLPDA